MKTHKKKSLVSLCLGLSMGLSMVCAASAADWSHDPESRIGTKYWGELSPAFRTCGSIIGGGADFEETGTRQSPIDIPASELRGGILPQLHWV